MSDVPAQNTAHCLWTWHTFDPGDEDIQVWWSLLRQVDNGDQGNMIKLLKLLRNWYWEQQRHYDLGFLWLECKAQAPNLDHARAAFAIHAFHDACWFEYYGEQQLIDIIGKLT